MTADNLIPSWLTSWVAWRNFYTEKDKEPFNLLREEFGFDRMPYASEFLNKNNGECPFCHSDYIVKSSTLGLVYCICQVLEESARLNASHQLVQSNVEETSLDDIVQSKYMGRTYVRDIGLAVRAAREFIRKPGRWLALVGPYGTGKTHILKAINAAFRPISLYLSGGKLEQAVHSFRKDDMLDELYDILVGAPVLIIDDVGMEYGGELVKTMFQKIIDARYEMWPDGPVAIATNLMPLEMESQYPRAFDRILDSTRTMKCSINAERSFRKLKAEFRA